MFLAYLDSSGGATFQDRENYALSSVITNESNWQSIDNGVKEIKMKHFPTLPDSEVELHAKDMMLRKGVYKGLSWDNIFSVLDDIFDFISDSNTDIRIISILIDKRKLRPDKDIETWAFRLLFERINKFISKENIPLIEKLRPPQYGIMIIDSCGLKADQRLRNKLYGMLRNGTMYSHLECLIEDPLFTDSKWRNLSQLADCTAYCIRRYHRIGRKTFKDTHWGSYYKKIIQKFDANQSGMYLGFGLKKFP